MMKKAKILYLFMGVWMFAATAASAAVAVCGAPCCMPGQASQTHEMRADGDCCGHSESSEAEAAAFFADDYTPPSQVLADDDEGCHLKSTEKCFAELHKGGEYVTHNLTIQMDAPEEAFAPLCAAIDGHPGFGSAERRTSASPPDKSASPIFIQISSFLC